MSVILIVDDEAIVREPLEAALSHAGHEPMTAVSGADALACIGKRTPDLVLLDVAMPLMNGLETLRALRQNPVTNHLPVIMLTQASEKGTIVAAARLGIDGYVLKPSFSLVKVLAQINRALEPRSRSPRDLPDTDLSTAGVSSAIVCTRIPESSAGAGSRSPIAAPQAAGMNLNDVPPLMTWSAVATAIDTCAEPKGFSSTVSEVLRLTESSDCAIDQVAAAINHDHAMAIKVLKIANSPAYRRGAPVDNILTAVLRIGLGQIRQAVMNMAVVDYFNSTRVADLIDLNQFWEHGVATGIIAAELARCRDETQASAAFTFGVLHDVGRLALAEQLPNTYAQVLATARERRLPLEDVERHMLCCTHAELVQHLFRRWRLGRELIDPIVLHHSSARTIRDGATQDGTNTARLALANRLAHALMLGSSGNETIYPTEDLCDLLQVTPDVMARIEGCAREETDKVRIALLGNVDDSNRIHLPEKHRSSFQETMRPLFVSSQPVFDACRIFCNQLAGPADGDPNVGIIHIVKSNESARLSARYLELEQQANASKLPLLVISPGGKIQLQSSVRAQRNIVNVTLPFTIERFINAVNSLLGTTDGSQR